MIKTTLKIIKNINELANIQYTFIIKKVTNTLCSCVSSATLDATLRLIGIKYNENKNPTDRVMPRVIIKVFEVTFAMALPIKKMGIPVHMKKVIPNRTNATITNIKFFLSTFA
ncbi:hypothetical protein [Bacillus alkalicola]|uniref:Uncharacterized protein n=1 Tax=Evansella alkalicola TaxID=745819 RepID=A0ABS6JSI3_9BACI|nr:hypothetical protein [Bacillus alkalicola]MBU9720120.1 hypothetical protein [Bacillus alkalicola]